MYELIKNKLNIKDNWAGANSLAPTEIIKNNVFSFLNELIIYHSYIDDVKPNIDGTVTIDWYTDNDIINLKVIIGHNNNVYYYIDNDTIITEENETNIQKLAEQTLQYLIKMFT